MMALDARERWCLSGTPIINFQTDIFALLKFCGYSGAERFSEFSKSRFDRERLERCILKVTIEDAKVKMTERINYTLNHILQDENEKEFYDLYQSGNRRS